MSYDDRLLKAVLRNELAGFIMKCQQTLRPGKKLIMGDYIRAIAWHLHLCRIGKVKRLIINVPPRYLKSVSTSIAFVAFMLGHNPTLKFLCLSYGEALAGELSRDTRTIIGSPFYRDLFPHTRLSPEKNTEMYFKTTKGGSRRASSIGSGITGMGADFIIIDDPISAGDILSRTKREEVNTLFSNAISSRLDDKENGCIIVVMQRLHMDDLTGYLLEQGGWTLLSLPAIAPCDQEIPIGENKVYRRSAGDVLLPEYESLETLNARCREMGSFAFSAQCLQCPIPEEGEILKTSWFKFYDVLPPLRNGERYVMSIDTATKTGDLNDYSVFTIWRTQGLYSYLVDIHRAKLLYPDLKKAVYDIAAKYPIIDLLIEDAGHGTALLQEIRLKMGPTMNRVVSIKPKADKVTRASTVSAVIEAGHVFLPRQALWMDPLFNEIAQFPNGRHDDQVDSMVQFLQWQHQPKGHSGMVDIRGL